MPHSVEPSPLNDLLRGVEQTYSLGDLKRKLTLKRTLRIKLGMDPTAPDIHLGHSVVLRKMRQFQDLGHTAVLIIGDYTARIGDPTGRDATRPILDPLAIQQNAQTYLDQAGLILDLSPDKFEFRYNSEWLEKLTFADILNLTGQFTVQQMLHRDNFKKRMADGTEIQLTEFMYPLMQAYDSVVIKADVELGGTDQMFNNLRGRDLMGKSGLDPQVVMVMPILVGLDGIQKMSKSKGNYVAVRDKPNDMYGKIMSIPDALMPNYFELLTSLSTDRITNLLDPAQTHPREAKDILGRMIVEEFYDSDAANHASDEFKRRFTENKLPENLETKTVSASSIGILTLITEMGFAATNSEARRLVNQNAVSLDDEKITNPKSQITLENPMILRVGKRRICRVTK